RGDGLPGDAMIRDSLARLASTTDARFLDDAVTAADWSRRRPVYQAEYLDMLGLRPVPPRTPLQATVTGTVEGNGFVVEKLHYQSVPGLYVTANLYPPARLAPAAIRPGGA